MPVDLYDEPSWGASLQGYHASRTQLPWRRDQLLPTHQVAKNNQNHAASGVYNPVLMRFNDTAVEARKVAEEADFNLVRMNVAKDRQLCYQQKFDLISHHSYLPPTGTTGRAPVDSRGPDSRVPYNLLSHLPKVAHQKQEVGLVPPDVTPRRPDPNVDPNGPPKHDPGARPFHLLSNQYVDGNHARQLQADGAESLAVARAKFAATRDYNPVAGTYYDAPKEAEYQRQVRVLEKVHGAGQLARLPPSVSHSEGAAFNVVTLESKDPAKLALVEGAGNRRFASKKGAMIEAEVRTRMEASEQLADDRSLARIGLTGIMKAREDGRHHGYDVVTNQHHHGLGAKPLPPSRLRPPEPVWARLAGGTQSHQGEPMGTSVQRVALASAVQPLGNLTNALPPTSGLPQVRDLSGPAAQPPPPLDGGFGGGLGHTQPFNATTGRSGRQGTARANGHLFSASARADAPSARSGGGGSSSRSAQPSARASARPSARTRVGGGATNAQGGASAPAPAVPSLKMPANITALQNGYV